ncbi:unnamed protein product [Penicillium egyptiacum]|uniref:DUF6546 domain-containing protein n=1 Tax=Penicillium egyptiacum TaxID=1303716 RepID=A0A9W4KQ13_9EURO|nr:unnamed protein product [Penicillium egyptiacum]
MESLPPELMSRVVDYIVSDRPARSGIFLAPYATVDRRWQAMIERHTFSYIYINTNKRLEEFQRLVSTTRRRACVRTITLLVELESYDEKARARFETDEERQQNNKIFTATISTLFRIISGWSDNASIALNIEAQSPSDYTALKSRGEIKQRLRAAKPRVNDLLSQRYERSYLEFSKATSDSECPLVPAITSLSIQGLAEERLIEPASSVFIALKLPRLNRVELIMKDECKRDERLRQLLRNNFARNLHLFPTSVRKLSLQFHYLPPRDQNYPPPDVTVDGSDLLSSHLRNFSQQLESLYTTQSVIGPELFWPFNLQDDGDDLKLPFWPNLINVSVEYPQITPSGEWLCQRERGEAVDDDTDNAYDSFEDDENDYPEYVRIPLEDRKRTIFRTRIIPDYVDKFYLSAGQAALRMPKLRQMRLVANAARPEYAFEYEVQAGRAKLSWSNEDISDPRETDASARLEKAKRIYQPDEQVFQIWRKVALQHTGSELEVEFKECGT